MLIKDKKTFFILLVALVATLTYFHAVVKEMVESSFVDFGGYWVGASLIKEGYNLWKWDEGIEKKITEILKQPNIFAMGTTAYSPGFFMLILPITLFPLRWATFLWLFLGHLLLFYSLWLILKTIKVKPTLDDILITLFLIFSFWPIKEELHLGQSNFLILFFLTTSLFLLKKEKMLLAGILLGLAMNVREYLLVLTLLFLWKRNWRVLLGIILVFVCLKGVAIFLFGWQFEFSYWQRILTTFGKQVYCGVTNLSLIAAVYRMGKELLGRTLCLGISLLLVIFFMVKAFFLTRKKQGNILLEFSLFLALVFLVSPWVHEAHYVALYPAIIISWFYLKEDPRHYLPRTMMVRGLLFILAYLLLSLRYSLISFPQFHSGILAIFSTGKVLGVILLFFLVGKLIQQENSLPKY